MQLNLLPYCISNHIAAILMRVPQLELARSKRKIQEAERKERFIYEQRLHAQQEEQKRLQVQS